MLYSLTKYTAILTEVKGYFKITAATNQHGQRSSSSLKICALSYIDNQLEGVDDTDNKVFDLDELLVAEELNELVVAKSLISLMSLLNLTTNLDSTLKQVEATLVEAKINLDILRLVGANCVLPHISRRRCIHQSTIEACCMKWFKCIQLLPDLDSKLGQQSTESWQ